MKFTQTLLALAAVFSAAQAGWNETTVIDTLTVTAPCTTAPMSTGTGVVVPTTNGTTYTPPSPSSTATPTGVVTAGAGSLDARVFVGAVAAVAAVAFTL